MFCFSFSSAHYKRSPLARDRSEFVCVRSYRPARCGATLRAGGRRSSSSREGFSRPFDNLNLQKLISGSATYIFLIGMATKHFMQNPKAWYILEDLPPACKFTDKQFLELWELHPEEFTTISIYGKTYKTPRWSQNFLQPYYYSGKTHAASEFPGCLEPILKWANSLPCAEKTPFNQVLVNWYADGDHYIGRHQDAEKQLIKNSPILSISLGGSRILRIREKKGTTYPIVQDIPVQNNTFLIMGGEFNTTYYHEVPRTKKCKEKRINITFRQFHAGK